MSLSESPRAATSQSTASRRVPVAIVVGLVAIVVAFVGIGALHALQQPPFLPTDETSHVGYAQEIASGRLPEIRGFPEVPIEARQWQAERSTANDTRYRGVWVANHPPLHYVAVAPLVWASRATGALDGGLILMRFANVAFAAVGVVFTFLLASEITRRNHRLALLAAALAALVPQGHAVFSQGLNDGLGFAAGTAVVWAGARCMRRIDALTRRDLVLLAATAAVAFGARAATMLLASRRRRRRGAVSIHTARPDGECPAAQRRPAGSGRAGARRGPLRLVLRRNIVLYGDVGASQYLLEMFRRERRGSMLEMIVRWSLWSNVFEGLMSPTTRRRMLPPGSVVLTLDRRTRCGHRVPHRPDHPASDTRATLTTSMATQHPTVASAQVSTLRWQLALAAGGSGAHRAHDRGNMRVVAATLTPATPCRRSAPPRSSS